MNPYVFSIGSFSLKWYSLLIGIGVIVGYLLVNKEAKKFNLPKDFMFDLCFWVIIFGVVGARLYYVIFNFSIYKNNLLEIFEVWNGGLAIHGGIIAGLITLLVYCKIKGIKPYRVMDIIVPSLILAQAIGRWGNFFNGEAHGPATTLANLQALHIPRFIIEGMQIRGIYYHPTFLYESLWCLAGFIILIIIRKFYKYLKSGQLTSVYLMWYSVGRFFIESLRTDSLMLGHYKVAQLVSLSMFIVGFVCFIYLCFNRLKKGQYYDRKEMINKYKKEEVKIKEKSLE